MSKFMMLIGASGCGKSTIAQKFAKNGAVIMSSDAMREEMWGDASDQQSPGLVFDELNKRTMAALKAGQDVVYDATNMNAKRRAAFLRHLSRNVDDLELECHLVVAEPQRCLDNQFNRERQVPEYAVRRQLICFQMPTMAEGWTKPIYVHNPFYREGLLDEMTQAMVGVSQKGPWHQETLDAHNILVESHAKRMGYAPIVVEMAKYHDIGKPFTRSVGDDGKTHFFGHANVGAYSYLSAVAPTGELSYDTWYRAMMIAHHMDFMVNPNHERLLQELGPELYRDLMQLHHADEFGSVRAEHSQMHVLDFMNTFYDWELRLKLHPFCCNVKKDGEYVLLQYQQLNSDFSSRVVQECRGSIFRKDERANWTYVCRPFDKFFNYGQVEAATVDWNTARVLEKVDGSIVKVWMDKGEWHLSTNGNIDAFKAPVSDLGYSYGDVFNRALGRDFRQLGQMLDPEYTYMFELTSPDTQLVVPYPDGVWYLSRRHTQTGVEQFDRPHLPGVKLPKEFHMDKFEDVLAVVQAMPKEEEGVVINDADGNRIKVKSPEYLLASHLSNNKMVSNRNLIVYMQEEKIDDFLAYCPQYASRVEGIRAKLRAKCAELDGAWERYHGLIPLLSRKEFAGLVAKERQAKFYIFAKLDHPELTAEEYIMGQRIPALMRMLGLKNDEFGFKSKMPINGG